jgi:ABC-type phosphate transport system substrate-binding protein
MNGHSPPRGRREFLVLGGAVTTTALTGCIGSGRAENTLSGSIRVAGGNEFPLLGSAVERFERSHPDVHVSREDWEGSDETPDIRFESQPLSNEGTETEGEYASLGSLPDGAALLGRSDDGWCRCINDDLRAELFTHESGIETWSEVDPDEIENAVGQLGDSIPEAGATVLAHGVRRHQYAIGYGGRSYYEANPASLESVSQASYEDLVAGSPLVRLRFGYADRTALQRPAVEAFAHSVVSLGESLADDLDYFNGPEQPHQAVQ